VNRFLFVPNPHIRLDRAWAAPYVPLELLSAMATARAIGADVALFDANRLVEFGRLRVDASIWSAAAAMLLEAEPSLVWLETWTGTLHNTLQLAEAIRSLDHGLPIVLAGAGTSAMATEVLDRFPFVDGVIRGEMEPAAAMLASRARGRMGAAPGLARRNGGAIVDAAPAEAGDLEGIARPAYDLGLLREGDAIPIESGRGCGQGCSFCALAGHWPPRYRARDIDSLATEMVAMHARHPASALDLTQDPVFFSDPDRVTRLCARLRNAGLRWTCHARLDRLSEGAIERMREAGCVGLMCGVESGCRRQQRTIGKHVDLDVTEDRLRQAAERGIAVHATYILGHEGEDRQSLRHTLGSMMRAKRAGASSISVQPLRAYPGSPVHARLGRSLEWEPLLCTAAPNDATGRELIRSHPALLSASYRVPSSLPRHTLLPVWLAWCAFGDVLESMARHDLSVLDALAGMAVTPLPDSVEATLAAVARKLADFADSRFDPPVVADALSYHAAVFAVSREATTEPPRVDPTALAMLREDPSRVTPERPTPHLVLRLHGDLERVLRGELVSKTCTESSWALVAKVPRAGEASHYTRRPFELETFELNALGAAALPLFDGTRSVAEIGGELAIALRRKHDEAVDDCASVVRELVESGVMGLRVR
jgi:Radical SAM superfamily